MDKTMDKTPMLQCWRPPWEMCATDPADGDAIRSESSGASELILRKSQDAEGRCQGMLMHIKHLKIS